MSDGNSMFSDKRSLHEQLSDHLQNCSRCQSEIQGHKPLGMGQRTALCSEYQDIIAVWAEKEGRVNNIVAHDEFGNAAAEKVYESWPEQWR